MLGTRLFVCNFIVCLVTSSKLLIQVEGKSYGSQVSPNETQGLNIFPGIKCSLAKDEIIVRVRVRDLLQETEMQDARKSKSKNALQRFGFMMIMSPFIMQVLSLPGAIASVKMSLLKSIMVAQLAIAIMIYNLIRSAENSEVVVVHKPHTQHHTHHYYKNYPHKDDEDEWFGR